MKIVKTKTGFKCDTCNGDIVDISPACPHCEGLFENYKPPATGYGRHANLMLVTCPELANYVERTGDDSVIQPTGKRTKNVPGISEATLQTIEAEGGSASATIRKALDQYAERVKLRNVKPGDSLADLTPKGVTPVPPNTTQPGMPGYRPPAKGVAL